MNARVTAAKRVALERYAARPDSTFIRSLLTAADEVMFSEAMEAKVAELLYESRDYTWQVQASFIFQLLRGEK
jgi:hypothetical protein